MYVPSGFLPMLVPRPPPLSMRFVGPAVREGSIPPLSLSLNVRHSDVSPAVARRRVTAIVYLNPGWRDEHAGHLVLHGVSSSANDVTIAPPGGRVVLFRSHIEHAVAATSRERCARTGRACCLARERRARSRSAVCLMLAVSGRPSPDTSHLALVALYTCVPHSATSP